MKIKERVILKVVEHNRGEVEETENPGFYRLFIKSSLEDYEAYNWTKTDLKDLADSINAILSPHPKKEEVGG